MFNTNVSTINNSISEQSAIINERIGSFCYTTNNNSNNDNIETSIDYRNNEETNFIPFCTFHKKRFMN